MKKIIALIVISVHLPTITVQAPFIINRTGQQISVNYLDDKGNPLFSSGAIVVAGSSDHTKDQMVLIPSTSIENPNATTNPKTNYQKNAVSAKVAIGNSIVDIPSFAAGTSYVITAGTTAGTFVANSGLITYDTITGAATPGNPSPVTAGAGF